MNNTEIALEGVKSGRLEQLGRKYLRQEVPQPFANMIATGCTPYGDPVGDPVDGIAIQVDRSVIGYMACTGEEIKGRVNAWKKKVVIDIDNAAGKFGGMSKVSGAIGVIAVITNRSLAGKSDLIQVLHNYAIQQGLQLELVDASKLADFLNKRHGLREDFLDITATELDYDLLCKASKSSLERHKYIYCDIEEDLVKRAAVSDVVGLARVSQGRPIFVSGRSGSGKSTVLQAVGELLLMDGRPTLWISDNAVRDSGTLSEAVHKALIEVMPDLRASAGHDATKRFADTLVFVVDDPFRSERPEELIEKLKKWAKTSLCPIIVSSGPVLQNPDNSSHVIVLGSFNRQETVSFLATHAKDRDKLAAALLAAGYDPFLFGLIRESNEFELDHAGLSDMSVVKAAADTLVTRGAGAAETVNAGTHRNDWLSFLKQLCQLATQSRDSRPLFEPSFWTTAQLTRDTCLAIGQKTGWGRLMPSPSQDRWEWAHPRIRDLLLGWYIASEIKEPAWPELAQQPELADAFAVTVCLLPYSSRHALLAILVIKQPLSLALILQYSALQGDPGTRSGVIAGLQTFLGKKSRQWEYRKDELLSLLVGANDRAAVLEATSDVATDFLELAARTAAGDIPSACALVSSQLQRDFIPSVRFPQLEDAIQRFGAAWTDKKDLLIRELGALANTDDDALRGGAIVLAGYLGDQVLAPFLVSSWENTSVSSREDRILDWAWALSRCADRSAKATLETIIKVALTKAHYLGREAAYDRITWPLGQAFRHRLTPVAISTWLEATDKEESSLNVFLLRRQDHEDVADRLTHWLAKYPDSLGRIDEAPHLGRASSLAWRSPAFLSAKPRLRELLSEGSEEVRGAAIMLLVQQPIDEDLDVLRTLTKGDSGWDFALRARAVLGDATVVDDFVTELEEHKELFLFVPYMVRFNKVREAFLSIFPESEWRVREVGAGLMRLPASLVDEWCKRNRTSIPNHPALFRYLWRSAGKEAMGLTNDYLASQDPGSVHHFFYADRWPAPITNAMALVLEKNIEALGDKERADFADAMARSRGVTWLNEDRRRLLPPNRLTVFCPTEEDIHAHLAKCSSDREDVLFTHEGYMLREMWPWDAVRKALPTWNNDSSNHSLSLLARLIAERGKAHDFEWFRQQPSVENLDNEIIAEIGHRCWRREWGKAGEHRRDV